MGKRRKMYANGTGAAGYLQSPDETMADYNIMIAKADLAANSNPGLAIAALGSQLLTSALPAMQGIAAGPTPTAANGTSNAVGQIEAEGGEVVEAPGGKPTELKGPKHESGGVDMNVPAGTLIFSDRIMKDGKTMAERKKAREAKAASLEKLLVHTDKAISNTATRTKENLDREEAEDLRTQELFNNFANTFAYGTGPNRLPYPELAVDGFPSLVNGFEGDVFDPSSVLPIAPIAVNPEEGLAITGATLPEEAPLTPETLAYKPKATNKLGTLPTPTAGDITGLVGDLISTFGPMRNTLENRAGDTKNVNSFKDFGKDALETNAGQLALIASQKANALRNNSDKAMTSKRAARNGARGINTQRAMDLAIDSNVMDADSKVADVFSGQTMGVLDKKSQLENMRDHVVMSGEQGRDLADRQDRDNFYTQKAQDIATMGTGLQQTGKDINQILKNPVMLNLLNEMSKYFTVDAQGNMVAKPAI